MSKNKLDAKDIVVASVVAGSIAATSTVQAQVTQKTTDLIDAPPSSPVLVDVKVETLNNSAVPTGSIIIANENGKIVTKGMVGANKGGTYAAISAGMVVSDNTYLTASAGIAREESNIPHLDGHKSKQKGTQANISANYVTDNGVHFSVHTEYKHLKDLNLGNKNTHSSYSETTTGEPRIISRVADKNAVTTTTETDTTTTHHQVETSTARGLYGSKSHTIGMKATIPASEKWSINGGIDHTRTRHNDGSREQFTNVKSDITYFGDKIKAHIGASKNIGDKDDTTIYGGLSYQTNNGTKPYIEAAHNSRDGNSVMVGVSIPLGENKSPSKYTQPLTPVEYMNRDLRDSHLADTTPHNMQDQSKFWETQQTKKISNTTTTTQTSVDTNIEMPDFSKILPKYDVNHYGKSKQIIDIAKYIEKA